MSLLNRSCRALVLCVLGTLVANLCLPESVAAQDAALPVDYLKQIKPLLKHRCYACHGALQQQAGLRLDTVALAMRGGDSGPAIVRGDAAKSLILARVSTAEIAERMPPEHEGEPLQSQQIAQLRAWIAAGAIAPADEQPEADPRDHWAFQPVVRPKIPSVKRTDWIRNPIDAFVAHQHERRGLQPQQEASRTLLLRRLSLDLVGVPPTPAEIAACQVDAPCDAYERNVQRLLNDPRHGQRWARHWMDIWRYSDWWGLGAQLRNSQPHIWHWRDWIVESLNRDVPYDEMVRLMLAVDETHPNDLDRLRASGYLARNYFLFNRNQWMDETVEHVSKGFLGLTTNCAKCHDHKYDPISQVDYYRLRAFFEPYHVRVDMVHGEADLSRDGIPRAFDGLVDAPTYRFLRGQESQPDQSKPLLPGVPEVLAFKPLSIEPVALPIEAYQPERRAWVADAYRRAAQQKLETAQAQLSLASQALELAQKREREVAARDRMLSAKQEKTAADPPDDEPAIIDKFTALDAKRWKLFGGEWEHQPGRLQQKKDGAVRSAARLLVAAPRDFDATLRFTILGGSQWRSVGLTFDSTQADPTAVAGADDSEQMVYVSAHQGGPKVQASFQRGGKGEYPADALSSQAIKLDQEYTLRVQVRDTLINATLDGAPVLAWRSPLKRRDGSLQITTFDALAVIHEFTLAPLKADVVLRAPGAAQATPDTAESTAQAVVIARQSLLVVELASAVAQAELHSVEQRAAAIAVTGDSMAAESTHAQSELFRAATRAEREQGVAIARHSLADAELRQLRASPDKREAIAKEVVSARTALDKATSRLNETSEQFTRFTGAQWSATRFRSSGADDPAVTFPAHSTGRRKALADWITDPRHPLTARVAVNHIWTRHFGTPLVPTVFDFGRNGARPTHPELLDWLAAELIDSGWSMKHVHRLIVESATYRMSSSAKAAEANLAQDPDNIYLWRRPTNRLESQVLRDSVLALAGKLDVTPGGPPVPANQQNTSTRRSLYFFHSNNERNLLLTTFDEALVKDCYRREQSIVPQQALALINSGLVLDAARQIAVRLTEAMGDLKQDINDDREFIKLAFVTILGSEPSDSDLATANEALVAWKQLPEAQSGDKARDYARAQLIWVLLNHNDFVTIR